MLGGEGTGGGYAFDIGEQQAAGGQRHNALDIAQPQRGQLPASGKPAGISPVTGTPSAGSPSSDAANRQRDNAERDRLPRQQALAEDEQQDRDDSDGQNEDLHLAELPGEQQRPLEKIVAAARHAEQAWQLGHGDGQAGAGLEADQDAVADQLHQDAQPQQPGEQAEPCHREVR